MDEQVGRILDALEKSGTLKNTIVVFASDNGLNIGAHGLLGKQNLYEEASRVPLIMSDPGIPQQTNSNALVYLSDIFPTPASMLQLKLPSHVASQGFERSLNNASFQPHEAQYLVYKDVQRAIRTAGWKYIVYQVNGVRTEQLFNRLN